MWNRARRLSAARAREGVPSAAAPAPANPVIAVMSIMERREGPGTP